MPNRLIHCSGPGKWQLRERVGLVVRVNLETQGTGQTSIVDMGPERLQEILPQIQSLAARVGGLDKLAEIIATLEPSKE